MIEFDIPENGAMTITVNKQELRDNLEELFVLLWRGAEVLIQDGQMKPLRMFAPSLHLKSNNSTDVSGLTASAPLSDVVAKPNVDPNPQVSDAK